MSGTAAFVFNDPKAKAKPFDPEPFIRAEIECKKANKRPAMKPTPLSALVGDQIRTAIQSIKAHCSHYIPRITRHPKMDTTDLPAALRQELASINTQVAAAEIAKANATAALAALQARIAAAADAQAELDGITEIDAGAGLAALAGGVVIDHDLRRLVDKTALLRQAGDAAGRAVPKAESALADAEAALTELVDQRKELIGDALIHARDDMLVKYAEASRHVQTVAAHLAGIAAAANDATGIHMPLPAGVGSLAMGQHPSPRAGEHIPPDAIEWISLHQCADADIVATSQAAWLKFADRLTGGVA